MSATTLSHRSLSEQAADAILDLILTEGLGEGDSLPSSVHLSRQFGVSVVVVREAMASLAGRGVLHRRQGREPVVAVPGHEILSSILRIRAHHDGISTDEFLEVRASLEVQAAGLAARRGGTNDAEGVLSQALAGMRAATTEAAFNEHDLAFHLALATLSGNRALELVLAALHDVILTTLAVTYRRVRTRQGDEGIAEALARHEQVAAAVIAGDEQAARAAMFDHFAFSAEPPA